MEVQGIFPRMRSSISYLTTITTSQKPMCHRAIPISKKIARSMMRLTSFVTPATSALFERNDVIVVASVSCIYGLGSPKEYAD